MTTTDPQPAFEDLPLGDRLAIDRTVLANERTLLAYVRTALGCLGLGITFLYLLDPGLPHLAGYGFVGLGPLIFLAGAVRFQRVSRRLRGTSYASSRQAS